MVGEFIKWYNSISIKDTPIVGGKTSSLGEMINNVKVPLPKFFAVTSIAYKHFISENGLEKKIKCILSSRKVGDIKGLVSAGKRIRSLIRNAIFPENLKESICLAYKQFIREADNKFVAIRSSATAEDLPTASFAGQQETFLNVSGEKNVLESIKNCFASLFTNRAISYREDMGFDHLKVYLSVAVQEMINSACSGVAFTLDPDSGFRNVVMINGSWGLGEYVVQGRVTPDEFIYFKPTGRIIGKKLGSKKVKLVRAGKGNVNVKISSKDRSRFVLDEKTAELLGDYCVSIERHYNKPMDIEWAVNENGKLFILQARPETIHAPKQGLTFDRYALNEKGVELVKGKAIGRKVGVGKVRIITNVKDIYSFKKGDVLVTTMTDPDWEPIMKIASAIITDLGGSTSHAAIVSREIGVPAIVGCRDATYKLKREKIVTVDCTKDEGIVYRGALKFSVKHISVEKIPRTATKVMINLGSPDEAFDLGQLPVDGVGLARQEFIVANYIREHPIAMIKANRGGEFIEKLAYGIARIAAAFYPREVIVRLSDFKSNEYKSLEGGEKFEPVEENQMIGWRGASRYNSKIFKPAFKLECEALKRVRGVMGLVNISILIPFCRTVNEGKQVLKLLEKNGLKRSKSLKVYVMAEIPSNIILAEEFCDIFDGFSIGSNDLTQLTLGIDRDNSLLLDEFDERNPAVLKLISSLISVARKRRKYVGICGDAPSSREGYAEFLVKEGISSISVTPDIALETKIKINKIERK